MIVHAYIPGAAASNGRPERRDYAYRGCGSDTIPLSDAELEPYLWAEPRALAPCGTTQAYRRHVRRGEPIDEACRNANLIDCALRKEARRLAGTS